MTSARKKVSSPKEKEFRWGFCLVMLFMLGVSAFLTTMAGSRFAKTAWGNLMDDGSGDVSLDGFIALDLSDTFDWDRKKESASTDGAGAELSLPDDDIKKFGAVNDMNVDADIVPGGKEIPVPAEAGKVAAIPDLSGSKSVNAALSVNVPKLQEMKMPEENAAPLDVRKFTAALPAPLSEPKGDFGPLPKDLADFESIILSTTDDGLRLPDDSLGDLPDMELPDEDIILAPLGPHWKEHVVKVGETLSDIAMQYSGVAAQDILRANGLKDANRLMVEQLLLVPDSVEFIDDTLEEVRTRQARVAALREEVTPLQVISYVVAAGDSLWSIASAQNLEVDTLVGSNTFKNSSVLHPGVVLRIPNQDGIFYKLKKGDSLETVAKRYQVAIDKIKKVNPTVDLSALKAESEIFLPGARPEAIAEVRTAAKKDSAPKAASSSGTKAVSGGRTEKSSRTYRWPVMGKINSPFGWRRHPITKRRDFHTGIDIKASQGTVIRSAREGKIAYSGWMGAYGKVVVVEHPGGQSTLYAHCSSLLVKQGEKVSVGQNISRVGSTGRTTGPHLHFEVRSGNSPVNPLKYLR